jgi:hypothetical protein
MELRDVLGPLAVIAVTVLAVMFYMELVHGGARPQKTVRVYESSNMVSQIVRADSIVYLRGVIPYLLLRSGRDGVAADYTAISGTVLTVKGGHLLVRFNGSHPFIQQTMWIGSWDLSLDQMPAKKAAVSHE